MTSWLPSSIQKRLLRYALLRSGFLDTQDLDLDSLDITLGRQNNIELRNVDLNVDKLTSLLGLPPALRLETARVSRLKLTVPADLYYGSIVAEVQGIDCGLTLVDVVHTGRQDGQSKEQGSAPSHRKSHRRIGRSPSFDPGGTDRISTTQDLARSFLLEESRGEVRELEEQYISRSRRMTCAPAGDLEYDGTLGTGTTPGLPGFLAGFLQGIIDRVRVSVHDIHARLALPLPADVRGSANGLSITLHIASIMLGPSTEETAAASPPDPGKHIVVKDINIYVNGLRATEVGSPLLGRRQTSPKETSSLSLATGLARSHTPDRLFGELRETSHSVLSTSQPSALPTSPADPFDIQAGEDNFTWNYRRSESGNTGSDIWSDMDQPADLAASITADQHLSGSLHAPTRRTRSTTKDKTEAAFEATASEGSFPGQIIAHNLQDSPADTDVSPPSSPSNSESMYVSAYGSLGQSSLPDRAGAKTPTNPVLVAASPYDSTSPMSAHEVEAMPSAPSPATYGHPSDENDPRTPLAGSLHHKSTSAQVSRTQLLYIDYIDVNIGAQGDVEDGANAVPSRTKSSPSSLLAASTALDPMPGAFSVYAEQSASVHFDNPGAQAPITTVPNEDIASFNSFALTVGSINLAICIQHISDLLSLTQTVCAIFSSGASSTNSVQPAGPSSSSTQKVTTSVSKLRFDLLGEVADYWETCRSELSAAGSSVKSGSLFSMQLLNTTIKAEPTNGCTDWVVDIGTFSCHVGGHRLLTFSENVVETKKPVFLDKSDIRLECLHLGCFGSSQDIVKYDIQTRKVDLSCPVDKIEDTFSSYGGISSLLELSSTLSNSEATVSPSRYPVSKGVRFHEAEPSRPAGPEIKVDARLGGLTASLSSRNTSFKVAASAIKAVVRSYIAVTIDNVRISGPFVDVVATSVRPLEIVLSGLRFDYLFHPTDADLTRLLSLLTPSKNKYENDDDILIDTLLRQRRKGSVARLTVKAVQGRIEHWDCIAATQDFANDLTGLAAVTKYLPEDDRPGMLSLIRIIDAQLQLPINNDFGYMRLALGEANVAQIGLPSLLAVSVNEVRASGRGGQEVIHPLMVVGVSEELPMLMARLIGDEIEPTLRVKLFNVCVEYSIPTIVALLGMGTDIKAEQVMDLMASTVIEMAHAPFESSPSPTSVTSSATKSAKKLTLDLLLYDCMIGLQPQGLESKAMLVLKNSKLSTIVPSKEKIDILLELRRASINVRDRPIEVPARSEGVRIVLPERLNSALAMEGFVSVASIMAARVELQIIESADRGPSAIELDIRNELFLLESCADSTQTLIKTLGALSPPSPPSKEPKYRVEAMSMDEMVSSFSGDAFDKPASLPSTIFDADMPAPPDDDDLIDASMTESIYGGFEAFDDPEEEQYMDADRAPAEIAESLIDEDPFEIPDNPNAARLSNNDLVKELTRQMASSDAAPVVIKPSFLTSAQIDQLSGESVVLGAPYRWNTPNTKHPALVLPEKKPLPFKLRLRDFHIIWNLYDGYDWQGTRQTITQAVEEVEIKAEERRMRRRTANDADEDESVIGDCLFNSIYIGVPTSKEAQDLRRKINKGIDDLASETESYATSGISKPTNVSGGSGQRSRRRPRRLRLERSKTHKIAFELRGVSADFLVFSPGEQEVQNTIDLRVRDLEVFDNLPTSTWRKFMTSWHKDNEEREMAKPMAHIEVQTVRPVKDLSATELAICVTVTPIRLHVDQDALDFMTRFFEFKDSSAPVSAPGPADQPFLQRVEVHTVDMCLDYKPKRVDYTGLRSGRYTEFKNFFILDAAHIVLKHAILYGIRGFDPLHDTLNDIWMPDIKRNQLPGVLSGLATVSPFVNLGQGVAGIVSVPIREYQKNGRIVRSIQKGAVHLARDTTSEIARFGARVAVGTQNLLTGAEALLSPASALADSTQRSSRRRSSANVEGWTDVDDDDDAAFANDREARAVSSYANQPLGVLSGLKSARRHLERDLLVARDAIIAVQGEILESDGAGGVAAAVARHAPTIMLRPVIGASRAVGQTLMGVGNQVDRANVKRVEDKYKQR